MECEIEEKPWSLRRPWTLDVKFFSSSRGFDKNLYFRRLTQKISFDTLIFGCFESWSVQICDNLSDNIPHHGLKHFVCDNSLARKNLRKCFCRKYVKRTRE